MPKKSLSSFDIYRFIEEIGHLNGGIIRGVKSRKNELYLLIYNKGEYWLKIVPGKYISMSRNKPEDTVEYPFTSKIKNEMSGKRVSISMHGSDRIVEMTADGIKIVAELFSNGNIILVKNAVIEMSMFIRRYGTRTVSSNELYSYPLGKIDVFAATLEKFAETIHASDKENVVKAIAIDLSLGGFYAEELCYRALVDKNKILSDISDADMERLFAGFRSMLTEPLQPSIIGDTLAVIEIKHTAEKRIYFTDINSAINSFFSENKTDKKERNERKSKAVEATMSDYKRVIKYMDSNYYEILQVIQEAKNSNIPIEKRRASLSEKGWSIDGKFIVRIGSKNIRINMTIPLRTVISDYYDRLKKLRDALYKKKHTVPILNKLPFLDEETWYSRFRWSVTKNGYTVVIGRDNNQNISLIDKHTDKDDIVLHADVFGSPFGVIKADKKGSIKDEDIMEGASLVASYSSAWKADAGNLDVYYVRPDQLKKGAPSSEYLKKGAFYIEGKRNYIKSVQLGLYISLVTAPGGYRLIVTAHKPISAYIFVRPGNKKREDVIEKIVKAFVAKAGIVVDEDRLNRLIPPGKASLSK